MHRKGGAIERTFGDEQERARLAESVRASDEEGDKSQGSGRDNERELPAVFEEEQAVQGGGRQRAGASRARTKIKPSEGREDKKGNNRTVSGAVLGFWTDVGGREAGQRRVRGCGSRNTSEVVDQREAMEEATEAIAASNLA